MINITVIVEDARLRQLSAELEHRLENVLDVASHGVERRAKDIVIQKDIIDTGATLGSIQPEPAGRLARRIGPSTVYAIFLELGTHRMAARPFMIPALEEERGSLIAAVKDVLNG